ncbi:radical SAM protein [Desulfosediminicola ganghwensis]|uniref:radical SAM protein n=1 Tax=Desulfosediminicola ganghwensis TaxID=2569540 RepID=UPI0010AC63FD|nr:radical SAM protein [Desulfosediminicola ganghwensis]
MKIDKEFIDYFDGNLKQVFLYITDLCNLSCDYCLYKTTIADRSIEYSTACKMLKIFKEYGAKKLTLIGGEPTLYDVENDNKKLMSLIKYSAEIGYEYIRLDTNGQLDSNFLLTSSLKDVSDFAFSLDSHIENVNDKYRGNGSYKRCVSRIKQAIQIGYPTSVTCCVNKSNSSHLSEFVYFLADIGVPVVNFHPLLEMGIERDKFTGFSHIDPQTWINIYSEMRREVENESLPIKVRIPNRYVSRPEYDKEPKAYNYCPVRIGERVLVHPDGNIRICALCIGTKMSIATYDENYINFQEGNLSEIFPSRLKKKPCMSQQKNFNGTVPLCISYKPHQDEYVWNNESYDSM